MDQFIGAHTVANGGIHMAAIRAGNAGMGALQIFTAPPQYYGDKASMRPERIERFRSALTQAKIAPERIAEHFIRPTWPARPRIENRGVHHDSNGLFACES